MLSVVRLNVVALRCLINNHVLFNVNLEPTFQVLNSWVGLWPYPQILDLAMGKAMRLPESVVPESASLV